MKYLSPFCILFLLLCLFTSGCKQEKFDSYDLTPTQDYVRGMFEFNKVFDAIDAVYKNRRSKKIAISFLPECAKISIDTLSNPRIITIDFGSQPCMSPSWDDKTRTGKIIATYSGDYYAPGTVLTITSLGYTVNASRFVLNESATVSKNDGLILWNVNSDNLIITSDSVTLSWKSNRERIWQEGSKTPTALGDDAYMINENYKDKLNARNSEQFSVVETKNLTWRMNCQYRFTKGEITLNINNKKSQTASFGNDTCNVDTYQVLVGDKKYSLSR